MGRRGGVLVMGAALLAAACSPALDWREVRPEASGAVALFPCRPASHARRLQLGAVRAEMFMVACKAAGATFALSYAELGDPAQVGPALQALRAAAAANVGAGAGRPEGVLEVKGMTPSAAAARLAFDGRLPSGEPAHLSAAFFARGTRVYQATVVAPQPLDPEALDTFFAGLRLEG